MADVVFDIDIEQKTISFLCHYDITLAKVQQHGH